MKCRHEKLELSSNTQVRCSRCGHVWSVRSKQSHIIKFVKTNKVDLNKVPPLLPQYEPK